MENNPGNEGCDEARAVKYARNSVGEPHADGRNRLAPGAIDQIPAAGIDDNGADQEPSGNPPEEPIADLLKQERYRASPLRDVRLDVCGCDGSEQQRHTIPSLSPLSMFNPWRIGPGTRGSVTTAWPSAASVGARTIARITASHRVN